MSKRNKSEVTPDALREIVETSVKRIIAKHDALALTEPMHAKTSAQWAQSLRCDFTPALYDAAADIVARNIVPADTLREAFSLNDAPVYGMPKLTGTILALSSGALPALSQFSKLHRAFCATLTSDWVNNREICAGIASRAVCSVTGTAPTQRSSSAYALRVLGIIEERSVGRTGEARYADTPAAHALRGMF